MLAVEAEAADQKASHSKERCRCPARPAERNCHDKTADSAIRSAEGAFVRAQSRRRQGRGRLMTKNGTLPHDQRHS